MKTIRIVDANELPAKTVGYIRLKTINTSVNVGLGFEEEQDLSQSLYLAALKARESFDPTACDPSKAVAKLETYLHRAVDNAAVDFLRRRSTNVRMSVLYVLDTPIDPHGCHEEDHEGDMKIDHVSDPNAPTADDIALHMDVAEAIKPLDAESRELCDLLMRGVSVRECARVMGLSVWDLRRRVMPKIAGALKEIVAR